MHLLQYLESVLLSNIMSDELKALVGSHYKTLGIVGDAPDARELLVTKFCQRIVQPHTKVLFLVTHKNNLLCVVKMMRSPIYDAQLQREKRAQEEAGVQKSVRAPRVYFEGSVAGRYVYAEEVVEGLPVSKQVALAQETELLDFIGSLPTEGSIEVREVVDRVAAHVPQEEKRVAELLGRLARTGATLQKGLTHGDLGRPNILQDAEGLRVIDWERAGDCPIRLVDAAYLLGYLHDIKNVDDWNHRAAPVLMRHFGINAATAEALYCIQKIFEVLYKKYPERYRAAARALAA